MRMSQNVGKRKTKGESINAKGKQEAKRVLSNMSSKNYASWGKEYVEHKTF